VISTQVTIDVLVTKEDDLRLSLPLSNLRLNNANGVLKVLSTHSQRAHTLLNTISKTILNLFYPNKTS